MELLSDRINNCIIINDVITTTSTTTRKSKNCLMKKQKLYLYKRFKMYKTTNDAIGAELSMITTNQLITTPLIPIGEMEELHQYNKLICNECCMPFTINTNQMEYPVNYLCFTTKICMSCNGRIVLVNECPTTRNFIDIPARRQQINCSSKCHCRTMTFYHQIINKEYKLVCNCNISSNSMFSSILTLNQDLNCMCSTTINHCLLNDCNNNNNNNHNNTFKLSPAIKMSTNLQYCGVTHCRTQIQMQTQRQNQTLSSTTTSLSRPISSLLTSIASCTLSSRTKPLPLENVNAHLRMDTALCSRCYFCINATTCKHLKSYRTAAKLTERPPDDQSRMNNILYHINLGIWFFKFVLSNLLWGIITKQTIGNNHKRYRMLRKYHFIKRIYLGHHLYYYHHHHHHHHHHQTNACCFSFMYLRWSNFHINLILMGLWFFTLLSPSTNALTSLEASTNLIGPAETTLIPVKLSRTETVCKSLDIRNSADQLQQLENCTVIEGFLLLTLITTHGPNEFTRSFPLLTEVTEFILIYQINNLRSLAQIFPNLSVIRGRNLFEGYALIVHSNMHLEELGLSKLTTISRGGVRIEKNMMLCYVKTVDWSQIVSNTTDIIIEENREPIECPPCPGDQRNSPIDLVCKEHLGRRNCWNGSTCQKICPERCRHNCLNETTCCNESCLGGCSPNNTHECVICRHFSINNDTCIDKCPDNGYSYLDRRCLTAEACMELRYKYQDGKPQKLVPYDGRCTTRCPEGYNKENSTCVKCGDKCKKVCVGGLIDSVARAKEFHGCTNITGEGLSIAIKRGSRHLIEDLEYGLGSIEVISTYLKVQGTIGMLNLHFLKKLQKIEGKTLLEDRYALYVLENSDMESVWAYNQTVRIGKGTVYFHFNPKLCLAEIEKLLPMLKNQTKFDKNEVSEDSNGSRGTCNTAFLNVTTSRVQSQVAIIDILNPMQFEDNRTFIGYQYLYIQDDYGNATKHGYRPCDDGWIASLPTKETRYILYNLKPYTQYAYYVKTMTISTERRNAQSPIQHFKTRSGQPKFVRMLEAYSNSSSEIIINWQPPITANGKLIKYKIRAVYLKDIQGFETRNYCKNPLKEIAKAENPKIDHPKTEKPLSLDDCKCQATKDPFYDDENAEANIHASIEFENSLQNFVYIKKQGNTTTSTNELSNYERSKRSIEEKIFDSFLMRQTREISTDTTSLNDVNGIESNDNLNDAIYREVNASTTEFVFTNLKHFSWYLIGVEACRQPEKYPSSKNKSKKNESEKECSMEVKTQVRTLMLDDVDKVENFRAVLERTNSSRSNIVLYWNRPSTPNGAVVSYTISYELQTQDAVEEKKCITEADYTALNYQRHGYVLSGLLSGNYSIRVRANSLAGEGKYSKTIYIYIPPTTPSPSLISGIVLATLLLLALLIIVVYIVYHKKYRKEPTDVKIFPIVNPYYVSLQYVPDEWEVARDRIIQLNSLGQGSFGMVYEGILRGAENSEEDIPCAIKTVNENATERERLNFLNEASVMKQFNTYHVVHLLGVCSRGQPALVIMELMKNGDLKSYLRAHRPDERSATDLILADRPTPPSLSRIYQMAIEIADGMAYLAAKKFVHRDLAARNCMVAADLTVKIGDFGMTRDIYETDYYRKGSKGLLPVRWMPPESLRDGVYSTASDVFSYGVVLWEMTTLASQPYQGLSNDQVLRYVIEGGVMERPENCPDILYNLMQKCWHHRPTARPTFMDIIRYLENMAEPYFRKVSFYHSDEGQHTMAKEFAERCKRSGDVYDLDEEYNRYNFHIDNNSSIEGKDENLMIMETEQQHSSLGLAITPSSTPDETVKHKFALSQNIISEQILHSAPSTSSGLVKDKRYVQTKSRRHSQVRMQQADDVDAYILPDCENSNCIDLKANDVNEQGYELYDPSPNYSEVGTTGKGSSIHTGGDDFDMKSPVVGDASHLMAMRHQPITIPNIMPCSSSMSDEIINQMAASSLHPSTASAASSTASSRATTTGRFKAVADSLKPVRMRVKNMRFFNQKRSSSNASDNSNTFILKNVSGGSDDLIASGENGANGDNTTNRNDAVGSLIGQNLSTIESGGSGSAGSYSTTPRFFTTTAGSGAVGSCGGDQRNYRRLNESSTHSAQEDSRKSGEKIKSELPSAVSAFTISTNPNYQKLEESFNTSLEETTTTMASIIQIRTLRNPSENTNYQPLDVSDSANYVIYDPEQKKEQHRQQQRPDVDSSGTVQMELSDNPNYKLMGPAPICTTTTYTIPTMTTVATPPPRAIHLERSGGLHTKRDRFNKFSGTPSTSSSSEHSTEEEEDEEDYEADEGIKMDRMPLRRRNRNNPAHRKCGGSSRDHSRSRSSSSHSHVTTPINTPTSVSVSANLSNVTPSMAAYKNTIMTTPLPVPPTSTATFSLKEKWLKQQQQHQQQQQQQNQQQHQSSPPPQSQPPPNGFVGREV